MTADTLRYGIGKNTHPVRTACPLSIKTSAHTRSPCLNHNRRQIVDLPVMKRAPKRLADAEKLVSIYCAIRPVQ